MKHIIITIAFTMCLFGANHTSAFANPLIEEQYYSEAYKEQLDALITDTDALPQPMPDYFSKTKIKLTAQEQENLKMARKWAENPQKPILLSNGKVAFLHGASIPTVIAAPFNITDLEFEAGESISSVLLGDTARWQVESGNVGNISHIFLKPLDSGLETSAVITSNKRVYHLRLVSQRKGHMPYVGFIYPEQTLAKLKVDRSQAQKEKEFNTTVVDGQQVSLSALDFGYKVQGSAKWRPVQVYNDGVKTYIKLPDKIQEMPILLAKSQGDVQINFRIQNNTFVVDGLFEELVLVLGVGRQQERVRITKG